MLQAFHRCVLSNYFLECIMSQRLFLNCLAILPSRAVLLLHGFLFLSTVMVLMNWSIASRQKALRVQLMVRFCFFSFLFPFSCEAEYLQCLSVSNWGQQISPLTCPFHEFLYFFFRYHHMWSPFLSFPPEKFSHSCTRKNQRKLERELGDPV